MVKWFHKIENITVSNAADTIEKKQTIVQSYNLGYLPRVFIDFFSSISSIKTCRNKKKQQQQH
jgi:hypothetical protein